MQSRTSRRGWIVGSTSLVCAVALVAALPGAAESQDTGAVQGAAVPGCAATASPNTSIPTAVAALPSGGFATVGPFGVHVFDAGGSWQASFLQNYSLFQIDVADDGLLAVTGGSANQAGTWIVDPTGGSVTMVPIARPFRPTASFWADGTSLYTYNVSTGISLVSITDGSLTRLLPSLPEFAAPIASDAAGRLYLNVPVVATPERTIRRILRDGTVELEFDGVPGVAGFTIDPATDLLVQVGTTKTVYAEDGTITDSYPSVFTEGANATQPAILTDGRLLATDGSTFYSAPSLAAPAAETALPRPGFVTDAPGHALGRAIGGGIDEVGRSIVSRIDSQSGAIVTVAGDLVYRMSASDLDATVIRSVAGADGVVHVLVDSSSGQRGVEFAPSSPIEPVSSDAVALADATGPIRTVDLAGNLRSVYPPARSFLPGSGRPIVAAYIADDVGIAYRLYPDGTVTAQSTGGGTELTIVPAAGYPSAPTVHDVAMADGRIWVADSTNGFVAFSATDGSYLGVIDAIDGFGGLPVIDAVAIMYMDGLVVADRGTLAISLVGCSVLAAPMPPSSGPIVQPEFTG